MPKTDAKTIEKRCEEIGGEDCRGGIHRQNIVGRLVSGQREEREDKKKIKDCRRKPVSKPMARTDRPKRSNGQHRPRSKPFHKPHRILPDQFERDKSEEHTSELQS